MSNFKINKSVENSFKEMHNLSQRVLLLADKTKSIDTEMFEHEKMYECVSRRIKSLSNEIINDGNMLKTYSSAGLSAVKLYYSVEQRLCDSVNGDCIRVGAAYSNTMTKEEIDKFVNSFKVWINNFLFVFNIDEKTRKKYMWYLEEYRQHLYNHSGINVVIIPPIGITRPVDKKNGDDLLVEKPIDEELTQNTPVDDVVSKETITPVIPPVEDTLTEIQTPQKVDRSPNNSNKLFDNNGQYGAKQRLDKNDKDLYEVIRRFYPDWTDAQCRKLIERLGPEGCGYTVVANALLYAYEGRAEEFESIYGISMYKNGDLNYDEIVTYIYSAYDEATIDGLTPADQGRMLDDMIHMGNHNMEVEFFYETESASIPDDVNKGVLTFSTQGAFDITPVNGGKTMHFDEAHTMTVTGVAQDGRLIVSTWGGKYYIDSSSCYRPYFTLFKFDTRGNI